MDLILSLGLGYLEPRVSMLHVSGQGSATPAAAGSGVPPALSATGVGRLLGTVKEAI